MPLVLVVDGLGRVLARSEAHGGLVSALLGVWLSIVGGVLLCVLLCVLLYVLMLEVTVERLAFPPAAVYHTSKMHCHGKVTGHDRVSA